MSGEAGEELDTPAARIMARRESRAAMPDRLKVAAPDDSSDEEWNGDDDEDEEEDGRVYLDASKCGRVRLHAVQGAAQSSSGLGVDDERRKSLADKGWARRTAVVNSVGASGAASFELVPGREQFGPGDDAAAEWERQMLQFTEDNFEDTGIEVRSMDKRDREIGLFAWGVDGPPGATGVLSGSGGRKRGWMLRDVKQVLHLMRGRHCALL